MRVKLRYGSTTTTVGMMGQNDRFLVSNAVPVQLTYGRRSHLDPYSYLPEALMEHG
jgi:hypothetical protein